MSNPSRTQLWMESLGDWTWPGQGGASEALPHPPAWVPALPPTLAPAGAGAPFPASARPQSRATPRRLLIGALLSALAAVCVALALKGPLTLDRLLGRHAASRPAVVETIPLSAT